jgi:predicted AAA+ superfamily ATPase
MIIIQGMKSDVDYHPRIQEGPLAKALASHPVVVLHGARQTGKSTLALSATLAKNRMYKTLDDFDNLEMADQDPQRLLEGGELLTLDEIQRKPKILLAIKREVDRKRKAGRFLLTGSANILLMKEVSETLAGRAVYVHLPPMVHGEIESRPFGRNLDMLFRAKNSQEAAASFEGSAGGIDFPEAVYSGGFPVPALLCTPDERSSWFDGYIQTYLERDLRNLSAIANLADFRRLMRFAALRNGGLLNQANLARDAGISSATAHRYLSLLDVTFQITKIPAFKRSRAKRLIKAPKLFWNDTGLAARLAGFASVKELESAPEWGAWLENFVFVHLKAFADLVSPPLVLSYWRTASGQEVDFILESPRRLLPIEVKATSHPGLDDARHIEAFLEDNPKAGIGVVACRCRRPKILAPSLLAVPIGMLLN